MNSNYSLGIRGEEIACKYLIENNYKIVEKRWHFKHKEIDIIAFDNDVLVVVEVKARTNNYWGNPEDFVSKSKQKLLLAAAEAYINKINFNGNCRFDVIAVVFNKSTEELFHIVDAFVPV